MPRVDQSIRWDLKRERSEPCRSLVLVRILTKQFGLELGSEIRISPIRRIILLHEVGHCCLGKIALPFPPEPRQDVGEEEEERDHLRVNE